MNQTYSQGKGSMLNSTAYILIAIAFFAGLLGGSLVGALRPATIVHQQAPAQQEEAGGHPAGYDENLANITAEISRNPNEALNWISLGNLHFDASHPDEAIKAYSKALELAPDNHDVMVDMGTMYRMKGAPDQALELYNHVIAADGVHQNAYFNKGVTLMVDKNDPAGAVKSWKDLLAVKPDATLSDGKPMSQILGRLIMDGGARLESKGQYTEAAMAYALALKEDQTLSSAVTERINALQAAGAQNAATYLKNAVNGMSPTAK